MRRLYTCLGLLLGCSRGGAGADGRVLWSRGIGGVHWDEATDVAASPDGSGGLIVAGWFFSRTAFEGGPELVAAGGDDGFVAGYAPDGRLRFAVRLGGRGYERAGGAGATPDGGAVVLVGSAAAASVVRVGPDGAVRWERALPGPAGAVAATADGGAVVALQPATIARLGAGGDPLWSRALGAEVHAVPALGVGGDGRILAGVALAGTRASRIVVLDPSGRTQGAIDLPGVGLTDVAWSRAGLAATGRFWGDVHLGGRRLRSAGGSDVFVAAWRADRTLAFASRAGGAESERPYAVAHDAEGGAVVAGSFGDRLFGGAARFGGVEVFSNGSTDAFVARFSPAGRVTWAAGAGGFGADRARAVAVLADGSVVAAGTFEGVATFGEGRLVSAGETDAFVARWAPASSPAPHPSGSGSAGGAGR